MTGNLDIFSKKVTCENFTKFILEQDNSSIFDIERLDGGINTPTGNVWFFPARETILQNREIGFEISSSPDDSDKIMYRLIYAFYKEFGDARIKTYFSIIVDSFNFEKEYKPFIKLEDDYKNAFAIYCISEAERDQIGEILLNSNLSIELYKKWDGKPLSTRYYITESAIKNTYYSLSYTCYKIDETLLKILMDISKDYEVLFGFTDDFELEGEYLEAFKEQIVHFY